MRKCEKKRIKRIRTHEKTSKLVKKVRKIEQLERDAGLSVDSNGPLHYWYTVLSRLSTSEIRFISSYEARPGHTFAVHVFKDALNTVALERAAQIKE